MGLAPNQDKIVQQLITQERLLAKLYATFAEQFPTHADFWTKLSKEEENHAKFVEKLRQAEQKGLVFFDENKINIVSLNTFINRLEKIIKKAEKAELTLLSAFTFAADYESALIEKNVFTHFNPANIKVEKTLNILQSETLKHAESIKNMRKKVMAK